MHSGNLAHICEERICSWFKCLAPWIVSSLTFLPTVNLTKHVRNCCILGAALLEEQSHNAPTTLSLMITAIQNAAPSSWRDRSLDLNIPSSSAFDFRAWHSRRGSQSTIDQDDGRHPPISNIENHNVVLRGFLGTESLYRQHISSFTERLAQQLSLLR